MLYNVPTGRTPSVTVLDAFLPDLAAKGIAQC